ncbi:MAG: transposase [Actinobacteria bacterium]|nr:transposase [Actinomycetota bacterium]
MPRAPRDYAAGIYHVSSHASDDRLLFVSDSDRVLFLDQLSSVYALLGLELISYVLMSNHYHALVYTPDARIARGLQRVHAGYSRAWNRRNGRRAHLFRAHCLARRVADDADLVTVCRYIARNPVEAGIVLDPLDWPWASTATHAGLRANRFALAEYHLRWAFGDGDAWRGRYLLHLSGG